MQELLYRLSASFVILVSVVPYLDCTSNELKWVKVEDSFLIDESSTIEEKTIIYTGRYSNIPMSKQSGNETEFISSPRIDKGDVTQVRLRF